MMSTVISDGTLAIVTAASAAFLLRGKNPTRTFGAGCLLFIAIAAAFGTARYAGADVLLMHRSTSWTSRMIAVPTLGAVYLALMTNRQWIRPVWYGIGLMFGLLGWVLPAEWGVVPGSIGMVLIVAAAALKWKTDRVVALSGWVGVVFYVTAGIGVGTEGTIGPMYRIDVFHYLLAIAHVALVFSMVRDQRLGSR